MFHSRTLNNKINRLQEKALRIVYGDYKSKFDELLEDGPIGIHHRNIQTPAVPILKFKGSVRHVQKGHHKITCATLVAQVALILQD